MKYLLICLLYTVLSAYNGFNVAFNSTYLSHAFDDLHDKINSAFITSSMFTAKSNGFLIAVSADNGLLQFRSSVITIKAITNNTITLRAYFGATFLMTKNCEISYLYFINRFPANFMVENSIDHPIVMEFDVRVSYSKNQFMLEVVSSIAYEYPTKGDVYTVTNFNANTRLYYPSWVNKPVFKFLQSGISFYNTAIANAVSLAIASCSIQVPFSQQSGLLTIDDTIIFNPVVSKGGIESIVSILFNGTITSNSYNVTPTANALPVYDNTSAISRFQYIISQGMLQNELDLLFDNGLLSFIDSYIFPDITIFNVTCSPAISPLVEIILPYLYLKCNYSCSVYTDKLSQFLVSFTSLVNMSMHSDSFYDGNSMILDIANGNITSYDIANGSAPSYSLFINHVDSLLDSLKTQFNIAVCPILFPPLFNYKMLLPFYQIRKGYIVYGE